MLARSIVDRQKERRMIPLKQARVLACATHAKPADFSAKLIGPLEDAGRAAFSWL